jgi:hypothetical protein
MKFAKEACSFSKMWRTARQLDSQAGRCRMHYSDYLREQAAKYRQLAETAEDAFVKQEFLELAAVCEEVANEIDDRRASG